MSRRLMQAKAVDDTILHGLLALIVFCVASLFLGSAISYLISYFG